MIQFLSVPKVKSGQIDFMNSQAFEEHFRMLTLQCTKMDLRVFLVI